MTMEFGWRRFNFFDKAVVMDRENPKEKFLGLKDVNVDCWCSAGDSVFLGEAKGGVFRLTNQLGEYYWKAYQMSLASLHSAGKYLFSIGPIYGKNTVIVARPSMKTALDRIFGRTPVKFVRVSQRREDDETVNSILKIWDPETIEKNAPLLKRSIRMSHLLSTSGFPASSVAVHSSLTAIVVGYVDGSVLFYQGDVMQDKSLNSRWIKIRDSNMSEGAVTGLAIAFVPGGKTIIFVITTRCVYSYILENRSVLRNKKYEANGATVDCWTFDESTGQLIVASREMVYFYDADQSVDVDGGVGRCLQLGRGHDKLQLVASGQYLALLTKQHALIQKEAEFMTMMTVYDVKGQYIGFSCSLPNLCRLFVIGNNRMLILGKDGTLSEMTEKNLNTKMDVLFKKDLYDVALGIVKNSTDGMDHLKAIHAKYADYLYGKGDYENAINQYKETIGMLEPSYVIKKYLDGTKLTQLCVYLEALHDHGKDNSHHTNILLNAYARRGEKKKLMQFVNKLADGTRNPNVRDIFNVLIEWNYLPEASLLATKFDMHHEALTSIIEHMKNYSMAVKYIAKRPAKFALEHLQKFGRILLEKCRDETLALLMEFINRSEDENLDYSSLFDIFIGDSEAAEAFVNYSIEKAHGKTKENLKNVILEIRLRSYDKEKTSPEEVRENIISMISKTNETQALQLSQIFDCSPVIEHILMGTNKVKELMQYYQKNRDLAAIIRLCKFCPVREKQETWLDALSYVAKTATEANEKEIIELLEEIEKSQDVHPLVVLEILSKSENLTISTVKSYVINWLQKQEEKIEDDRKTVRDNQRQMDELDKHIESLKFDAQVLQVSKCSACDTVLQLPTVHFLCKHSFHVHCFGSYSEGADKCPACTTNLSQSGDENDSNLGERAAYSKFQKELEQTSNSMELIARYLERGLFDDQKQHKSKRGDATRRHPHAAAHLSNQRSSGTNPFEEEDFGTISRTMSTVSSSMVSGKKRSDEDASDVNNPFMSGRSGTGVSESKNPFGTPKKSTNPFED